MQAVLCKIILVLAAKMHFDDISDVHNTSSIINAPPLFLLQYFLLIAVIVHRRHYNNLPRNSIHNVRRVMYPLHNHNYLCVESGFVWMCGQR